jgi:hypothetical protein
MNKKVAAQEILKVAKELTADANSDYKLNLRNAQNILRDIEKELKTHQKKQAETPQNWTHTGELEWVNDALMEVKEFLERHH